MLETKSLKIHNAPLKGIIYNHKHSANAVSKEDNHADLD